MTVKPQPQTRQNDLKVSNRRVFQVFDYLKSLNEHRNPTIRQVQDQPWYMWLDNLPKYSTIQFQTPAAQPPTKPPDEEGSVNTYLMRISRPKLTPSPVPAPQLAEWLVTGWEDPFKEVEYVRSKNKTDARGSTITIRLEDDPIRMKSLQVWEEMRDKWRQAEIPARKAMQVFEAFYALHGQLGRESEKVDLVIGDGLLSWRQQEGDIYHPLLIQRVQLVFDAVIPEFTIVDADFASELNTTVFQTITEVDPRMLADKRKEFEASGCHPLSEETNAFLAGFVNRLSPNATLVGKQRPENGAAHPNVGRCPVLYLRARTRGFSTAIEQVIQSLGNRTDFCAALQNIVGCDTSLSEQTPDQDSPSKCGELPQQDVLFGKEANPEQIRIARQLDHHGAVLVQGPPGTGKSHTIANLIGHLLANGNSILVTSHTTKALHVLRRHVEKKLQPLCVSVLENDLESRRQLEESVQAISRRLSESDGAGLSRDAETLAKHRDTLIKQLESRKMELLQARRNEFRDVVIGGKSYSPSDAARRVAGGAGLHDWIPSPVALGEPLPLSSREIADLYATNASTEIDDEKYAHQPLPDSTVLLSPDDFEESLKQSQNLVANGTHDTQLWRAGRYTTSHIEQLQKLKLDFQQAIASFDRRDGWCFDAIQSGRLAVADGGPWKHLLLKIDETRALAIDGQVEFTKYRLEISGDLPLMTQQMIADELVAHTSRGKGLSTVALLLKPRWKRALNSWRANAKTPSTQDELIAVRAGPQKLDHLLC